MSDGLGWLADGGLLASLRCGSGGKTSAPSSVYCFLLVLTATKKRLQVRDSRGGGMNRKVTPINDDMVTSNQWNVSFPRHLCHAFCGGNGKPR
jgi:hypothetical protein